MLFFCCSLFTHNANIKKEEEISLLIFSSFSWKTITVSEFQFHKANNNNKQINTIFCMLLKSSFPNFFWLCWTKVLHETNGSAKAILRDLTWLFANPSRMSFQNCSISEYACGVWCQISIYLVPMSHTLVFCLFEKSI